MRLYPRSWRRRYGAELEGLVEDMPRRLGVSLDLLVGAAVAYRDVIRANRVLSAAGAYLHGICIAVLLQAIAFVSLVLAGQGSVDPTELRLGPIDFATVVGVIPYNGTEVRQLGAAVRVIGSTPPVFGEFALLAALFVALAIVLATPRLLRSLK